MQKVSISEGAGGLELLHLAHNARVMLVGGGWVSHWSNGNSESHLVTLHPPYSCNGNF